MMLWLLNPTLLPRDMLGTDHLRVLGSDRVVAACGSWCDR